MEFLPPPSLSANPTFSLVARDDSSGLLDVSITSPFGDSWGPFYSNPHESTLQTLSAE